MIHAYAMAAVNLYGVIPQGDLIRLFNTQNGKKITEEELFSVLIRHISLGCGYALWEEYLVNDAFEANNYQDVPDLLKRIGDKPRYIPPKQEFLKYADPDYYEQVPEAALMRHYLLQDAELEPDLADEVLSEVGKGGKIWLQVHGLLDAGSIKRICDYFHISFLTTQDILNTGHQPKIEDDGTYITAILRMYKDGDAEKDGWQEFNVSIVLGEDFVLTFMETENDYFEDVAEAISKNVFKIREHASDYLFSVLLNSVISNYVLLSGKIDDSLEELGSGLMTGVVEDDLGIRLQSLRRKYLQMRQGIAPLRDSYVTLFHTENPVMHYSTRPFFKDVNDHLQLTFQTLEICRETIASLTDLYISNNDMRMNAIMKRLTIVSTIFIPLTFLVGVWGMNFKFMPELDWRYGYLFAWILMAVIALSVVLFFRGKKWK